MDRVEELLAKRRWQKHCLRTNIAEPEDIITYGKVKVANALSNVLNKREKEPELYDAIKETAPEWRGDETQITLNRIWCARGTETVPTKSTLGSCGWETSRVVR